MQKAIVRYPIRKVTTPVPVEGGVAGGALPVSAGTSFQGRRKPNGSACQRRTVAGVQEEAKHAMSAMSPLKSCEGREAAAPAVDANKALVLVPAAVLEASDEPSTYNSRRPDRQIPAMVDQVVSFTIATDDVMVTVPPPLAWWRRLGLVPDESQKM